MSQYFNHTQQGIGVVNQVENLATEVEEAFTELEDIIELDDIPSASIHTSIGSLDNKYIHNYTKYNKNITSNYQLYTQPLYFPENSKEASLDLIPHTSTTAHRAVISLSNLTDPGLVYTYKYNTPLTTVGDFTIVDKKLVLFETPALAHSLELTYRGYYATSPDDDVSWPFDLRYNIIQFEDISGNIVKDFTYSKVGNVHTITGYNFQNEISDFILNLPSIDRDKYVAVYQSTGERVDNISNVSFSTSSVSFQTPSTIIGATIKLYVANSSLGALIEGIYRLFYNHDHSLNGGNNINHNSLVGLFENKFSPEGNPIITYRTSIKSNYDHPQYLNREGYINDPDVYNNSVLGDLLLAAAPYLPTPDTSNAYNHTNTDSVKIIFGSYSSGHKAYYNKNLDCLYIDSLSRDGIRLNTQLDKRAVAINDHYLSDTTLDTSLDRALNLSLFAEDNTKLGILKLTRRLIDVNGVSSTDDEAKLITKEAEITLAVIKEDLNIEDGGKITFGTPNIFEIYKDGIDLKIVANPTAGKIKFESDVDIDNLDLLTLEANEIKLTDSNKIVYNLLAPNYINTDYINYDLGRLNIKSTNAVNFKENGRQKGITLDERHYIYSSISSGVTTDSSIENNLYIENQGDIYLLKSGYTWTVATSLSEVDRSSVYLDMLKPYNIDVQIDLLTNLNRGLNLGNSNSLFVQNDALQTSVTIFKAPNGIDVVTNYTRNTGDNFGSLTHGVIRAKRFEVPTGIVSPDSGLFGNVSIPTGCNLTVYGGTNFHNAVTFQQPTTFTNLVTFNTATVTSQLTTTNFEATANTVLKTATVSDSLTTAGDLLVKKIAQNDSSEISSFAGAVTFNAIPTFNVGATFIGTINANNINAERLDVVDLKVTGQSEYEQLIVNNLTVNTQLDFSLMHQTNNVANSIFEGTVEYRNNVYFPNTMSTITVGSQDIETTRDTSGIYIREDEIRMGTNGLVATGKVLAAKGTPSGNGDRIGGFAFAATTGQPDGDTGFFAENNIEMQADSDLVFRIDGVKRATISKIPVNIPSLVTPGVYANELVTVSDLIGKTDELSANMLEGSYPIGTIYQNSIDGRDPKDLLQWSSSSWRRYSVGRSMMGAEGTASYEQVDAFLSKPSALNLATAGFKYGDFVHTLTIAEMPIHNHKWKILIEGYNGDWNIESGSGGEYPPNTDYMEPEGGDMPHNNTHPIIVTYIWERVG